MSIRSGFRFVLGAGIAVIAAAVLAVIASQSILYQDTARSQHLDHLSDEGMQLVQLTNEVLLYGEGRAIHQWRRQHDEFAQAVATIAIEGDGSVERAVGALSQRFARLGPLFERLAEARAEPARLEVISILQSQMFQDVTQLQASLRDVNNLADEETRGAYERSKRRQLLIFAAFIGLLTLYVGAASILFGRVIMAPLEQLGATIRSLRGGAKARVSVRNGDEMGAVGLAFNTLLDEQDEARRRLNEMADRFRNIFEQAAVGMCIVATDGRWLEVNQRLCAILGRSREEILASGFKVLADAPVFEEGRARAERLLGGEIDHDSWESVLRRKDGTKMPARITTGLARADDGVALYFVTVIEDITLRREAEDRLIESNRSLEEHARVLRRANADLESFAWVASHDLREPLRMISNYVSLIERRLGPDIDGDLRDFIRYAVDGARRMYELVGGLLQYARVEHNAQAEMELVPIPLVIEVCLNDLGLTIAESGATIEVIPPLPNVTGIRGEFERVFRNLIENAIKYRRPGQAPRIVIDCLDQKSEWHIRVRDDGIGIAPEYQDKVFGMFQRIVPKDEYDGTGIGLSICKKIVELAGGRIWFESSGEGTTFIVALPKIRSAA